MKKTLNKNVMEFEKNIRETWKYLRKSFLDLSWGNSKETKMNLRKMKRHCGKLRRNMSDIYYMSTWDGEEILRDVLKGDCKKKVLLLQASVNNIKQSLKWICRKFMEIFKSWGKFQLYFLLYQILYTFFLIQKLGCLCQDTDG